MSRRKKQKKPIASPLARLIAGILLSPIFTYLLFGKLFISISLPLWILGVISGVMIAYFIYGYVKEKRNDKKFQKIQGDIYDNCYFTSSEWREKYLEYVQKKSFKVPNEKGMKTDLTARFRKNQSVFLWVLGISLFPLALFLYDSIRNDEDISVLYPAFANILSCVMSLILVIIAIALIRFNIKILKAYPVKNFYEMMEARGSISDIERSYEHGMIFSTKNNGINIGSEYTVIYNQTSIYAIKNSDIITASRNVVRQKKYDNYDFIYKGDKFAHKLYIRAKYENYQWDFYIELDEFQVEAALDEISRFTKFSNGNAVSEVHLLNNSSKNN